MPCPPVSFESAAATSTDAGISFRQSSRNRQNSSLVKTVSKSATFLLQFLDMSDAACNGRDVLFTRNLGKRNRKPQPAPASRSYLHGISGRYAADAEIRRLVAHSLGSGGNICRHDGMAWEVLPAIRLPLCSACVSDFMPLRTGCSRRWIIRYPISFFQPLYARRRSAWFWWFRALRRFWLQLGSRCY